MKEKLRGKKIGLITNFYHLPRALRFWTELLNEEFKEIPMPFPISAESLVDNPIYYMKYNEYLVRLEGERSGLGDIEKNCYDDNCLDKNFKDFKDIIKKKSTILLTKREQKDKKLIR